MLDATVDAETVANFGRLADRVGFVAPRLKNRLAMMKAALGAVEGVRVRELLATAKLLRPRQPRRRRGRR
jgi:hypothetical protein